MLLHFACEREKYLFHCNFIYSNILAKQQIYSHPWRPALCYFCHMLLHWQHCFISILLLNKTHKYTHLFYLSANSQSCVQRHSSQNLTFLIVYLLQSVFCRFVFSNFFSLQCRQTSRSLATKLTYKRTKQQTKQPPPSTATATKLVLCFWQQFSTCWFLIHVFCLPNTLAVRRGRQVAFISSILFVVCAL